MKKSFTFLSLLLVCFLGLTLWSCSDSDKEETVYASQLPQAASSFLDTYFKGVSVSQVTKEIDDNVTTYEVILSNGHEVDFYESGEWYEIEAVPGQIVPAAALPAVVTEYLDKNYPGWGVYEISKESYGYDVELTDGTTIHISVARISMV